MTLTERLRQRVSGSDTQQPTYERRQCGSQFEHRRHVCPDCCGYRVERQE
jgi:rRNA maturation endonuclease Nob1